MGFSPLFRIVVPAFTEINVFSYVASRITALGAVMVATMVKAYLPNWRVEVIDENNYHGGPVGSDGLPDHEVLQRESPASVVGFSASLTSTIERVWKLTEFYRSNGILTIAGGWHVHYLPEESLRRDVEIVVHGEGEKVILRVLAALESEKELSLISGISYIKNNQIVYNPPERLFSEDLEKLPFPDFGVLRYARLEYFPIGRIRGCSKNCEFCSVRGRPFWSSARHLFETVEYLVQNFGARKFFIVDDRLEEDRQGTIRFFRLIAENFGNLLDFTVQVRLEVAKDTELISAMKAAGVRVVCIGYESCTDEELTAMRKGYLSKDMIEWSKILHGAGFSIHGMFIFGYPIQKILNNCAINTRERVRRLKKFITDCKLETIQILRPVPLPGTGLRSRLEKEGRLFSLEVVPWSKYDGSYVCFKPDDMTLEDLQEYPTRLMRWFYSPMSFLGLIGKLAQYPFYKIMGMQERWYRQWRSKIARYGGYRFTKQWYRHYLSQRYLEKIRKPS